LTKRAGLQVTMVSILPSQTSGLKLLEVDAAGNAVAIRGYGPFGENGSTAPNRFGYTGQQYIAGLGLYYYKARWYSPTMGRFLETDPIGYGDGVNWYGYVGNNPVNRVDPSGLDFTIVHGVPSSAVPYQAPNGQSFMLLHTLITRQYWQLAKPMGWLTLVESIMLSDNMERTIFKELMQE
jgi:RHS repeat-associated protein